MTSGSDQIVRDQGRWPGRVALLAASAALAATFLPWGSSGRRSRTSYELTHVVVRFDLLPPHLERLASAWFLLPVLVGLAWLARGTGRRRLAATLSAVAGLLCVVASTLTLRSPLAAEPGAPLALGFGALAGAAAVLDLARRSTR